MNAGFTVQCPWEYLFRECEICMIHKETAPSYNNWQQMEDVGQQKDYKDKCQTMCTVPRRMSLNSYSHNQHPQRLQQPHSSHICMHVRTRAHTHSTPSHCPRLYRNTLACESHFSMEENKWSWFTGWVLWVCRNGSKSCQGYLLHLACVQDCQTNP